MGQIILKNIEMTLDDDSIQKAIDTVLKLKEDLADALAELARYVTEEKGPSIAKMYLAQFPAIDTGALHDSINGEYAKGKHEGVITTGVMYAAYVEFGTGIVGDSNPHPEASENWSYDIHDHGDAGWWYPSSNGWYKPKDNEDAPLMAWTKGMPARPYMYNTYLELEAEIEADGGRIVAEYIP